MQCDKCRSAEPDSRPHYHIIVVKAQVVDVWYVSGDGYWDRELEKDEYFVEYRDV